MINRIKNRTFAKTITKLYTMNNTTIILGNGFDIDLGWKTSYRNIFTHPILTNPLFRYGGSSYVKNLVDGECWSDFEGYLRKCVEELDDTKVKELNFFWILCRNNILNYFNYQSNQSYIYQTNQNSCAYHFITHIVDNQIFSFNYTNPFKKLGLADFPIDFVHGKLEGAFNGSEIKVGIDNSVVNPIIKNEMIAPLVKSSGSDAVYRMLSSIKETDTLIIYGHSLGITDSDYFKPIFESMIDSTIANKNVYLVTRDASCITTIAEHMADYGINYDKLHLSNNSFHHVFTCEGADSKKFKEMMKML